MTFPRAMMLLPLASAVASAWQTASPPSKPADVVPVAALFAGAPMATIAKDGLSVTVGLPDPIHGFYRSTRFDWSGMVTEARLGSARFYGPWFDGVAADVHDFVDTAAGVVVAPPNAATGTAEEFVSRDGEAVPGYDAAAPGGTFVKIGVGRLRKPDAKPYDHFRAYEIVDGGQWSVQQSGARIVFRQHLPPDATGYGFDYEKTLTLSPGGEMTIAHRLRNTGTKALATQIYTHNFARFDGADLGPGVSVAFPFAPRGAVSNPALATIEGNTLRYLQPLRPGDRVQLPAQVGGPDVPAGPFRVTGANGASITFDAAGPLVRTAFWSIRRTVAVEPFVPVSVAPGAEQDWEWRYRFDVKR